MTAKVHRQPKLFFLSLPLFIRRPGHARMPRAKKNGGKKKREMERKKNKNSKKKEENVKAEEEMQFSNERVISILYP